MLGFGIISSDVFTAGYTFVAANIAIGGQNMKKESRNGSGVRFEFCPCCGRKGLYHCPQRYSRCRYCGLYRIALPGQDF